MEGLLDTAILDLRQALIEVNAPWFLGFSGGKDSTAVLKILWAAQERLPERGRRGVTLVYCDTGVDIPLIARFVLGTLEKLREEASRTVIPLNVRVAKPRVTHRFFVRVIGRGYPPPTTSFRWCTKFLRINPIKEIMNENKNERIMMLGLREKESEQRRRSSSQFSTGRDKWFYQGGDKSKTLVYCPIYNFYTPDVWQALVEMERPRCIDVPELARIYKSAGGECPIIRDPRAPPCGKGRFGCWTCTVVRRDRAVGNLIESGHDDLEPLLRFRDWLATVRNDYNLRCRFRRNGSEGSGPFRLGARKHILQELLAVQRTAGIELISNEELFEIKRLWRLDEASPIYKE
jgi:DNA sulfur modification protein DndC